jgi:hypothetical protein
LPKPFFRKLQCKIKPSLLMLYWKTKTITDGYLSLIFMKLVKL